jgi:glycosyltransferase involved in cell wall biosynthesis
VKILALHDGGSGCALAWYRIALPLRELAKHGHELTMISVNDDDRATVTASDLAGYDVVVGQRLNVHRGMEAWRRARGPFSRLVYDTDDDVFSVNPENWAAYHLYGQPDIQDAVVHMCEVADLVTVTTEHLAGVMRGHTGNASTVVLPNCVPAFVPGMPRAQGSRPAVGYQGGASHGADVGLIAGPVRRFLRRFPGWDLRLGGTDYRPTFRAGEQVKFREWVPVYDNPHGYYATLNFDIGLAPLVGKTFDRSKSNIKVLEYGARGIPAIASDCDVYRSFIRHGENGFLVREDHEWLRYLSILANDDELRRKMGEMARADARNYLIEDRYTEWERAYTALF